MLVSTSNTESINLKGVTGCFFSMVKAISTGHSGEDSNRLNYYILD